MSLQTWTYSGDPAASDLDAVRFLIGDTDSDDRQIGDEELLYLISTRSSVYSAAALACRTLAAKYARETDRQVGDLRISASSRQQHYHDLAKQLAVEAGEDGISPFALLAPYAGGISRADRRAQVLDTDRVAPSFTIGMDDFPKGRTDMNGDEAREYDSR